MPRTSSPTPHTPMLQAEEVHRLLLTLTTLFAQFPGDMDPDWAPQLLAFWERTTRWLHSCRWAGK